MTWHCLHCGEYHTVEFDACWKCGRDIQGDRSAHFDEVLFSLTASERNDLEQANRDESATSAEFDLLPQTPANVLPERSPPKPFRERLSSYVGHEVDESELDDRTSQMPFWMASIKVCRTPIKAREFIRRLLRRIQRQVRGSRYRN